MTTQNSKLLTAISATTSRPPSSARTIFISVASNYERDPNTATAAKCWKDDIVILQHPTVRSASEVSLLHCSNIYTEVREFTMQVHTLVWFPQFPCIQSGKVYSHQTHLTYLLSTTTQKSSGMRMLMVCHRELVPSSLVTQSSLDTPTTSMGCFNSWAL